MKLVVDTNRVIAALIRDSVCREIIMNKKNEFITPDFTFEEIDKHKNEIIKKSGIDESSFDLLIALLFQNIEIIPRSNYESFSAESKKLIGERDEKDFPFLALALAEKSDGIWSDDKDFEIQNKITIFKTKDLLCKK